jgi:hypothetical protein
MTAAERAAQERKAQGLPERVEDGTALALVAGLIQETAGSALTEPPPATRKAATRK